MKLAELKNKLSEYLHLEDMGVLEIVLATTIATRLEVGNPVWLVVVGVSSGGKSQIIRPLADGLTIHRIDDLTENTLISGMKGAETSLLLKIGPLGMLIFSDLTALFSKSQEARDAILGQLRLVYDGELTKYFGNQQPITWRGRLGVVAGSTPSIYRHFEKVADMGERFIYYRMKTISEKKATTKALAVKLHGRALDERISELYTQYQQAVIASLKNVPPPLLSKKENERVGRAAAFAAKMRTPIHYDFKSGLVDRIPSPEMPMRVALQLSAVGRGLAAMHFHETGKFELEENQLKLIDWCAYSLADEERRACLRYLSGYEFGKAINTQSIANQMGLDTSITRKYLQALTAIGILSRTEDGNSLAWVIKDRVDYDLVRQLEGIAGIKTEELVEDEVEFGGL